MGINLSLRGRGFGSHRYHTVLLRDPVLYKELYKGLKINSQPSLRDILIGDDAFVSCIAIKLL